MNKQKISILITITITWTLVGLIWYVSNNKYEFQNPILFFLLGIIPLLGVFYFFKNRDRSIVNSSQTSNFEGIPASPLAWSRHILHLIKILGFTLIIITLAHPISKTSYENISKEGLDIILAMDVSGSMLSKDFKPNRLESSKKVAASFVAGRPDDRFGAVVYEGEAFTLVPLTADHRVVETSIKDIETGLIEGGTAIGMGLATAVNRLKDSDAKSKIIILLTDGVNNQGQINPLDAAKLAKAFDIRVYTIGVGSNGKAMSPVALRPNGTYVFDLVKVEIDEQVLKNIAKETDGKYFRANNEKKLKEIYKEIDKLEKTKFNVTQFSQHKEEFKWFGLGSILLLILGFVLEKTIYKGV